MSKRRDKHGRIKDSIWQRFKSWRLGRKIRAGKLPRGRTAAEVIGAISDTTRGQMTEIWGVLEAAVSRNNGAVEKLGVISTRKVTEAFRDYVVDCMQNSTTYPLHLFKYHASGTDNTAEANNQTDLVSEVESRVAGTLEEGATSNIFKTVATCNYSNNYGIVEHGIFSNDTSGTLMDRSVFAAINVGNGDSIQFTYQCTFNAEA